MDVARDTAARCERLCRYCWSTKGYLVAICCAWLEQGLEAAPEMQEECQSLAGMLLDSKATASVCSLECRAL